MIETSTACTSDRHLIDLVRDFQVSLNQIKRETPLPPALSWYPWPTLSQFEWLDSFLDGDVSRLRAMIGGDPVLDLGCGDGDSAFFFESLGYEVDAIDFPPTNFNALFGIRALQSAMKSNVAIKPCDLDGARAWEGRDYGFVVMLGVLYHLKNPYWVLETLAKHSRFIFLSTRVAEHGPRGEGLSGLPLAYLVDDRELNDDPTNFWIFTENGLRRLLARTGWDVVSSVTRGATATSDPVHADCDARAFVLAKSRLAKPADAIRPSFGWYEMENGSWRWTQPKFGFRVSIPEIIRVGHITLDFKLPPSVFEDKNRVTLTAKIGERELGSRAYGATGAHRFECTLEDLPAGSYEVCFELDSAIGPTPVDARELGVLVEFLGAPPLTIVTAPPSPAI